MQIDTKSPGFKTLLKEALDAGCVSVTFTKVSDGSARTMVCTRSSFIIPSQVSKTTQDAQRKYNDEQAIAVYELSGVKNGVAVGSAGWRSFRWDSIKSFCIQD